MSTVIVSFLTLSFLEIVLGIDNIVILSILLDNIKDPYKKTLARYLGLSLALSLRIICLFWIVALLRMTHPLFTLFNQPITLENILFFLGGGFLVYKGIKEIRDLLIAKDASSIQIKPEKKFFLVVLEIGFIDFIFAIDSIITAIGLSRNLPVMISANIFAIILMLILTRWISQFLEKHPAFKVLGISCVLLIGGSLLLNSFNIHFSKGYLYSAIGFAVFVEIINSLERKK